MNKTVTIEDIAKKCGVSRWTVSAVLNPSKSGKNQARFSEATRKKVLKTAQKLKYRSNRASRNLLLKRTGVIGVLTSQFFTVPWQTINMLLEGAAAQDRILSFELFYPEKGEVPLFIKEKVADGIIIFEPVPEYIEAALEEYDIPAVFANAWRYGKPNSVNLDDIGAMDKALRHLAENGYTHPALILPEHDKVLGQVRIETAQKTLAYLEQNKLLEFHLDYPYTDSEHADACSRLVSLLDSHPECDAVITPHDGYAGMVYKICAETGRNIPDDLAVICMQDPPRLKNHIPPVSGFLHPAADLGKAAIDMLARVIEGAEDVPEELIAYPFRARGSTAEKEKQ